jgi:hypothetical protein
MVCPFFLDFCYVKSDITAKGEKQTNNILSIAILCAHGVCFPFYLRLKHFDQVIWNDCFSSLVAKVQILKNSIHGA